ncbi:hypothetical protein PHYPSEUDO_003358 [Phytophthora pseudosyringae]|uniref:DUF547 domain-containing protein n=1 Tax=Phytophthora pseudosyringae TaxID=221518 RepID=A0A8T1VUR8_9STRA|nr:hypothetical protein PHYPSEUDO_003358 [Phytophthora pseudosyringae]
MPLWRQSRNSADVFQELPAVENRVKGDTAGSTEPKSIPLRQLVARSPPATNTKPTLQLAELRVDSAGHVECSSTSPCTAPPCSQLRPNAREPHVFENEFVRGKLLLLLDPSAMKDDAPINRSDTLVRIELFQGKSRLLWVQLQLQFKQVPPGGSVLYIGGEVPRAMRLDSFTGRGCNLLLGILRPLVRGLHYSFGEADDLKADSEDAELPHISSPLYTAVDQFVRTPAGQEPPELGSADFGESKEEAAQRRRSGASGAAYAFNTEDTYSFHVHSDHLDLLHWQVTNVPGMETTDLTVFWEEMPLHLAAYFVTPSAASPTHSRKEKKYQFCFQLSHSPRPPPDVANTMHELTHRLSAVSFQRIAETPDIYARLEELQRRITKFAVHVPAWFEYLSCSPTNRERRVGYVLVVREYVDAAPARDEEESKSSSRRKSRKPPSSSDRKTTNERVLLLPALSAFAPLSFLVHQDDTLAGTKSGSSGFATSSVTVRSRRAKLRTIEGERAFLDYYIQLLATPLAEVVADDKSEYTSRDASCSSSPQPEQLYAAQRALLEMITTASSLGSVESEWPFLSADAKPGAVHVVRVVSSTQWRHEWLVLDEGSRALRFSRLLSSSSASKTAVPLDNVLGVSTAAPTFRRCSCTCTRGNTERTTAPLYWLHIEMVTQRHHVAFVSPEARRPWLELLSRFVEKTKRVPRSALAVSSNALGGKHFVMNDCSLTTLDTSQRSACYVSTGCVLTRPLDLVSSALKQAQKLSSKSQLAIFSDGSADSDFASDLLAFHGSVQRLQRVDLSPLTRSEGNRLAFFLNLYHLIVVHANVLGLKPKSKSQRRRFFNGASYRLGVTDSDPVGSVFPLAQIELCVLRATRSSDFRINFALNCTASAGSDRVLIFSRTNLDAQLDEATRQVVGRILRYDEKTRVVYLPKSCDWHRDAFAAAADVARDASLDELNNASLGVLLPYATKKNAKMLEYAWRHPYALIQRYEYVPDDFRCSISAHDERFSSTESEDEFTYEQFDVKSEPNVDIPTEVAPSSDPPAVVVKSEAEVVESHVTPNDDALLNEVKAEHPLAETTEQLLEQQPTENDTPPCCSACGYPLLVVPQAKVLEATSLLDCKCCLLVLPASSYSNTQRSEIRKDPTRAKPPVPQSLRSTKSEKRKQQASAVFVNKVGRLKMAKGALQRKRDEASKLKWTKRREEYELQLAKEEKDLGETVRAA